MLASPESDYVLENPTNLPMVELYKKFLPLDKNVSIAKPVKGSEIEGYSPVYRNGASITKLKKYTAKGNETVHSVFDIIAHQNSSSPCFKYRPYDYQAEKSESYYETMDYGRVKKMKDAVGSGIIHQLQNNPYKNSEKFDSHKRIDNHLRDYGTYNFNNHSFIVTLYSSNRYEWLLTDLACSSYSITNTALYDTLGANTSEYILELTQSPIVICSKGHVKSLINLKQLYPKQLGNLITIVSMDPLFEIDYHLSDFADKHQIKLLDFNALMGIGQLFPIPNLPPEPETLYTISFTSGTTGANPKGVSLTNEAAASSLSFLLTTIEITPDSFSFLPYAHIFERETVFFTLGTGGCVILPQMNYSPLTLVEDLKLSKPYRVSLVPRVYNKFEAAIKNATINNPSISSVKKGLFKKVFDEKIQRQCADNDDNGESLIYDSLIIKKIKQQFGFDNMKFAITGSAPIDPETVKFLRAALQCGLSQGYGLTETFAGVSLTLPFDATPGSSGPPAVNTEMKVRAIPDMGYNVNDKGGPRGELMIRGYQNFIEYYKNPEETEKSVDKDGWFLTGDVAQISSENGRITIVDRVKNFFKLAQGEYISPESIENNYQTHNSLLSQMYTHGDSFKTYLVAILGIDKPSITAFLSTHCGIKPTDLNNATDADVLKFINNPKHKKVLVEYINSQVPHLKGFQKIKNAFIEFEPLTLDRNVVTPTMKLKRPVAKKFFESVLEELYAEGPLIGNEKL